MSSGSHKLFLFSHRKKSNPKERPPPDPEPQEVMPYYNLPILPPELWIQIVNFVPLERLWPVRGTARLWNWIALVRAWQIAILSNISVSTYLKSEHTPLSYLAVPESLQPLIPPSLQLNQQQPPINDPSISLLKMVTWRVKEPKTARCGGLRFSYFPYEVQIHFDEDLYAEYNMQAANCVKGTYTQFARTEAWSGHKRLTARKLTKNLLRLGRNADARSQRTFLEGGSDPGWIVKYQAQYNIGVDDDINPAVQLYELTLHEVSLPISHLIRIWINCLEMPRKNESTTEVGADV